MNPSFASRRRFHPLRRPVEPERAGALRAAGHSDRRQPARGRVVHDLWVEADPRRLDGAPASAQRGAYRIQRGRPARGAAGARDAGRPRGRTAQFARGDRDSAQARARRPRGPDPRRPSPAEPDVRAPGRPRRPCDLGGDPPLSLLPADLLDRPIDGTRLTGQAMYGTDPTDRTSAGLDVAGYTVYYGVLYGGRLSGLDVQTFLQQAHRTYPKKPIMVLEYGHWADR